MPGSCCPSRQRIGETERDEDARYLAGIKTQLDAGADFAQLAKEKSIEPGAKDSGGDLGYFTQDKMVKPFGDAAFALKVNEISQPIQTQFGWHIIQVLDRRPAARPTLEALTPQIGQQLYVAKYRALFDQLRKAGAIDIPDAALKQQVEAQLGPGQGRQDNVEVTNRRRLFDACPHRCVNFHGRLRPVSDQHSRPQHGPSRPRVLYTT